MEEAHQVIIRFLWGVFVAGVSTLLRTLRLFLSVYRPHIYIYVPLYLCLYMYMYICKDIASDVCGDSNGLPLPPTLDEM